MKLFVLLLLSCFHLSFSSSTYNAIFNFGDSISDTGNLLLSGGASKVFPGIASLPYGSTFFGRPTGRCSDGRLIIDFIAEAFGLPFLPPILTQNQSFVHGANFAVAGATALDASFFEQRGFVGLTNYTLNLQLQWFEQLIPSLCHTTEDCRAYLSKSLFFVGEIGGNDYIHPTMAGLSFEEVQTYVPFVVETISNAVERLINLGAVNLVVPGTPSVGCMGQILTMAVGNDDGDDYETETGCLKKANNVMKQHNDLLRHEVAKLRRKHPHVNIIYADLYQPVIQFFRSPSYYGFKSNPLRACCGGGGPYNFDFKVRCGEPGSSVCGDPSSSLDWDGDHLTETAYHQVAQFWLKGLNANLRNDMK
ncbi:GDSL esterase/lipase [Canna indica]|uniref:GDSL esterase/lipase n=1 Tax=Canna indica TaxID=4628 RepID=A0AAQ3K2K7_9LILI|nr:GDSL esterase/lipase [Canna indica]